jgi:arginase
LVSTSGEAADMELGLALGRHIEGLPMRLGELLPLVRPEDVVALGPRDREEIAAAGVESLASIMEILDDRTLKDGDSGRIAETRATHLHATVGAWWLHVDLDVLSTEALPAVDYLQPGGLGWPTLAEITGRSLATAGVLGWDVTIYNPDLDPTGGHARRIVDYIATGAAALP